MAMAGPTTASALARSLSIDEAEVSAALVMLESEGIVLRGSFTGAAAREWCDRHLLARIHRYTINRLRAEIEPVAPADFMRFLFAWQHVDRATRVTGIDGLRRIIGVLDGFELAASAWERAVLPARVDRYDPSMLDMLCLTGEVGWARLSAPPVAEASPSRLVGATPIALFLCEHADAWRTLRLTDRVEGGDDHAFGAAARRVLEMLRTRGASFLRELAAACASEGDVHAAIGELVAAGQAASDGFAGLRAIVRAADGRPAVHDTRANSAGRWSALRADADGDGRENAVDAQAWSLLRRYGVVFRRLLTREANAAPWRELTRVYRRLEARGEIRGGRFVSGMSGEQFALAEAVDRLRAVRRTPADGTLTTVSTADPLNLAGIVTSGDRIRASATGRLVYRDGVPVAALEGDYMRALAADVSPDVTSALTGRSMAGVVSGYVGRPISRRTVLS
jgi:ATP-dependent Lhr-like helicase